jgi:alpha-amylase/alpha-mannosidase (GH57 family)
MTIWHDTPDAARRPRRVPPGQAARLMIGTWPIQAGQSVSVSWEAIGASAARSHGRVDAQWRHNSAANSYWLAQVGPFNEGDRVTYSIHGSSGTDVVESGPFALRVRPLNIAWLWHQHQPLYRDPSAPMLRASYRAPWVRLHALRDYYSMPALAAEYDVRVTFNLTPVLLQQIDDYLHGATDRALELTAIPAELLNADQSLELLATFFEADWHHQIYIHPRYRQLFEQRVAGVPFSHQAIRDLQMWGTLAWFGHEFRHDKVVLSTGETVDVQRFVRQQRHFSHDDVLAMVQEQYKILRAIVPLHRALQEAGRIEVSTTPGYHPILPLLIDTDGASLDRPGASLPQRFAHPDDAAAHVNLACRDYAARFGRPPSGMWPAEGAVSEGAVKLIAGSGVAWVATDAGVLARSGQWGYTTSEPDVLCQPYRTRDDDAAVAVFFRDTDLSDSIGFRYGAYESADAAVHDFIGALEKKILERLNGDEDRVLTIALDGENAWGGYHDDGRPFLRALYQHLASDPRLRTVTFSEFISGNSARRVESHPIHQLTRVFNLATGSWIDEPGSTLGVDLGTWIGEPEENTAWTLLNEAREAAERTRTTGESWDRAYQSLLAAEGSDWFWWLGSDQESSSDAEFDDLFRLHLRAAYTALGLKSPASLEEFIVTHPVVWTFTRPIAAIRPGNQLLIRTNCPGGLAYSLDDLPPQFKTLAPVGGVMAGASRYQLTLGPFPTEAARLIFRFHCAPGCRSQGVCCRGEPHVVAIGHDFASQEQTDIAARRARDAREDEHCGGNDSPSAGPRVL